jgi:hypothetical protein
VELDLLEKGVEKRMEIFILAQAEKGMVWG